jgi:hypothetical protein
LACASTEYCGVAQCFPRVQPTHVLLQATSLDDAAEVEDMLDVTVAWHSPYTGRAVEVSGTDVSIVPPATVDLDLPRPPSEVAHCAEECSDAHPRVSLGYIVLSSGPLETSTTLGIADVFLVSAYDDIGRDDRGLDDTYLSRLTFRGIPAGIHLYRAEDGAAVLISDTDSVYRLTFCHPKDGVRNADCLARIDDPFGLVLP